MGETQRRIEGAATDGGGPSRSEARPPEPLAFTLQPMPAQPFTPQPPPPVGTPPKPAVPLGLRLAGRPFPPAAIRSSTPAPFRYGARFRRAARIAAALKLGTLCCALAFGFPTASFAADDPKPQPAAVTELDDPVEKFTPKRPRAAGDVDRLEAESLFATARLYEQRQQYSKALQTYQRALRNDPESEAILRPIVQLAFRLNRSSEALRYAVKLVELAPNDVELIRRLASHLIETDELSRAVKILEGGLQAPNLAKESAAWVILHSQLGDLHFLQDEHKQAAEHYAQLAKALAEPAKYQLTDKILGVLEPEKGQTWERMAESFLRTERKADAAAALAKLAPQADKKPPVRLLLAEGELLAGRPDEAWKQLEAYLERPASNDGEKPWELAAKIYVAQGKDPVKGDDYLKFLRVQLDRRPQSPALALQLADRLQKRGEIAKAIDVLAAQAEAVESAEVVQALARLYRRQDQLEPLLASLGKVFDRPEPKLHVEDVVERLGPEGKPIAADPALCKALLAKGEALFAAKGDRLGMGERAALGVVAIQAKEFALAETWFGRALEASTAAGPRTRLLREWGQLMMSADRYEEAIKPLQRMVDEKLAEPDDPTFLFHLSGCLTLAKRYDDALKYAKQAAANNRDVPLLARRIPWILQMAKRYPDAIREYERLIDRFSGTEGAKECRLSLSGLYVVIKDLPKAEEQLELVLDEFPDDPSACNDLGYLWADQGKHLERCLRMVKIAVDHQPDNHAYRDSLGWVYYRLGRYEEALAEMQKAAAEDYPDGVILDHLGDVYDRLGRRDKAKESWERAVKRLERDLPEDADRYEQIKQKLSTTASP